MAPGDLPSTAQGGRTPGTLGARAGVLGGAPHQAGKARCSVCGPRPSTPSCLKMGCPGPGAGRVNPRSIPGHVSQPAHLCHTGQKRIPCVGGQSRPPSQRTEKRALVRVVPGGQHPLGPCCMKSNWCGQAEVGCGSVAGAGRPPGAARRQDRGPGRRLCVPGSPRAAPGAAAPRPGPGPGAGPAGPLPGHSWSTSRSHCSCGRRPEACRARQRGQWVPTPRRGEA